ncbi:hypothetical protein CVT26_010891 [Gymnopilus dilepis]|uniref:Uncharacterized protein n=1 Tax=Gymnopilus dilepis TaxID=231916 RepID=A0A409VIR1_9AGAR|nr:hypothetical protein CVT26_010891 [Gymnopilus dilepis]
MEVQEVRTELEIVERSDGFGQIAQAAFRKSPRTSGGFEGEEAQAQGVKWSSDFGMDLLDDACNKGLNVGVSRAALAVDSLC